jgi:hypothetical protein
MDVKYFKERLKGIKLLMTIGLSFILFVPLFLDLLETYKFAFTTIEDFKGILDVRHGVLWNILTVVGPPLGVYAGINVLSKFSPVERDRDAERRQAANTNNHESPVFNTPAPTLTFWDEADVKLKLVRLKSTNNWSVGYMSVLGTDMVYGTVEDEPRETKVPKETRIPSGDYYIEFNKADTSLTKKYKEMFPDFFTWHLEIVGIKDFDGVYIHIGNTEKDTAGCPLIGFTLDFRAGTNSNSKEAFREFYLYMKNALVNGKKVAIRIIDED